MCNGAWTELTFLRPPDSPRVLSLPSADEITAMEHIDILRLNGFDVDVDESAGVGERVKLTAQPVSKDTVFDIAGKRARLCCPSSLQSKSLSVIHLQIWKSSSSS